jgi:hypothetical protein
MNNDSEESILSRLIHVIQLNFREMKFHSLYFTERVRGLFTVLHALETNTYDGVNANLTTYHLNCQGKLYLF